MGVVGYRHPFAGQQVVSDGNPVGAGNVVVGSEVAVAADGQFGVKGLEIRSFAVGTGDFTIVREFSGQAMVFVPGCQVQVLAKACAFANRDAFGAHQEGYAVETHRWRAALELCCHPQAFQPSPPAGYTGEHIRQPVKAAEERLKGFLYVLFYHNLSDKSLLKLLRALI